MGDLVRVDVKKREMLSRTPGVVVLSSREMMMAAVGLAKVNPRASAPAGGPITQRGNPSRPGYLLREPFDIGVQCRGHIDVFGGCLHFI